MRAHTGVLVCVLATSASCTPAPRPSVSPPPEASRLVRVCVLDAEQGPRHVQALVHSRTEDTVVVRAGVEVPLRDAYRSTTGYPQDRPWYDKGFEWNGRHQQRFGLVRRMEPSDSLRPALVRVGEYDGVALFGELGDGPRYLMLFLPVNQRCEFQRYGYPFPSTG
ncbi:hypothetical protein BH23GEM5_BH23GEM5_11140 [soil metagenome]